MCSFDASNGFLFGAAQPLLQRTLAMPVSCEGIGLHTGKKISMRLLPADVDAGVIFVRTDLLNGARKIKADWKNVVDTRLCTVIGNDHGGNVATVEHLMAALAGTGVDNALIEINGPEVPIMDGSADPFVFLIEMAGLVEQKAAKRQIEVLRPIEIIENGKSASVFPANSPKFSFDISFGAAAIGEQSFGIGLSDFDKVRRARTFGFRAEVEKMREMGLALGGSLNNAIVVDGENILNEGGLRYSDEFVRHKLLDTVGDFALAGAPVCGHFYGNCSGHAMNNKLLRAMFSDPTAWRFAPR